MADAISNTSPLLYLHRVGRLDWLSKLFGVVLVPRAVVTELDEGRRQGHDVPDPSRLAWGKIVDPRSVPSEWLTLDLGAGELSALALALENTTHTVLLDDALARRTARAAGLTVMGTLGVLLDAKARGLTDRIAPLIDDLTRAGMWLSPNVQRRILALAGE